VEVVTTEAPREDTLGQVMSSPVTTIKISDSLAIAAKKMVKQNIGSVVVLEGKVPVGIITERDVTRQVVKSNSALKKTARKIMSKLRVTASPAMSVQQAFEMMLKNEVKRLPVLDDGKLVGIVTEKDLMRWVLRVSYEPNIPPHIKAILESH
jgi:CBS domain-containing protein